MNLTEEIQKHKAIIMEAETTDSLNAKLSEFEKEIKKTEREYLNPKTVFKKFKKKKVEVKEEKEDFRDTIGRLKDKSKRDKNPIKYYYYSNLLMKENLAAAVDYETFIHSWAGEEWLKKNKDFILSWAEDSNKLQRSIGLPNLWKFDFTSKDTIKRKPKNTIKEDYIDDENAYIDQQYNDDQNYNRGWNDALEAIHKEWYEGNGPTQDFGTTILNLKVPN